MIGAGINIIPVMIQRNVPGIGPYVLLAYALGTIPAFLAALAYAILGSAMPRAGGSYVYASRALHPFLGFVASFSQWFGISMTLGVVSFVLVPFLRDIASALGLAATAEALEGGVIRVTLSLVFLWTFTVVNLLGAKVYQRTLIPLMFLMFIGGAVVIPTGFYFDHQAFITAVAQREDVVVSAARSLPLDWGALLGGIVILSSTFIGFDSIAQAGGEAKSPNRTIPLAITICLLTVGAYYLLYTAAIYHAVPWNFVAERAVSTDLTAPGLLGYLLTPGWTVAILIGATIALANDLPAMILSVSRLMFAWAEDGIFPAWVARISQRWRTPHYAILLSSLTASVGILGNQLAGDFFMGVDLFVTAMLVNFWLMSLSVLLLPHRNPAVAAEIRFVRSRPLQIVIGGAGALLLGCLLVIQVAKDVRSPAVAWYFHSTYSYLVVMAVAALIFAREWWRLKRSGVDVGSRFSSLPRD
jgi:amino acid transporter